MMKLELKAICNEAETLVRDTGAYILSEAAHLHTISIEEKSKNSLVSKVDKKAEELLVEGLRKILPDAGYLTEEEVTEDQLKKLNWIIDPLDGTTNFLYGIPSFCISVALQKEDELVIGIIYELGQKEMFTAWKSGGARLNGKKIEVSKRKDIEKTLLATGFPYYDFSQSAAYFDMISSLINTTRGVRRIGSAAMDMAYVACGRFDGFFEYSLQPWDVAGGAVIISEAGGKVTDFSGGQDFLHGKELICGNPEIHDYLLKEAKKHFK